MQFILSVPLPFLTKRNPEDVFAVAHVFHEPANMAQVKRKRIFAADA